ncbi:GMP reductase [Spirochaeta africana]|uniref:GMP reductase n=1 Tax=Spirochaeta africana (strain ATCC 700263 / DSM 8902 / Z-7692) TaxID=889378 RepID=H9UL20_SPIAZ|nr:GMP reductase [Spirochaeta africana]AFG38213.1 IMP dehydrogenase/GMP reductase [Spirochaeta africana DSM 8902]
MLIEEGLRIDFSDVLFKPMRSTLRSRSEVQLIRKMKFRHSPATWEGVPIMAANMDTTGTFAIARKFMQYRMITTIHKHYTLDDWKAFLADIDTAQAAEYVVPSMGTSDQDIQRIRELFALFPRFKFLCIDVANGYSEFFSGFVRRIRQEFPEIILIAGNVVSGDMTQELILSGADIVKVGIGPGSACTTRIQTGVGMSQLSAIIDCANVAHGLDGQVIGDGGCTCPGDVAKAFGGGADFVMIGGMFAGHDESGGEMIEEVHQTSQMETDDNGTVIGPMYETRRYKMFYGMSSKKANEKYAGGLKDYRSSEGREVKIPYRGPIEATIIDLTGGLRSACTYVGARTIKDLPKCTTFVRVTTQYNTMYEK